MNADDLNKALRSELSAIETYRQALDKHRERAGSRPEFERLAGVMREHEDAAARLRDLIRANGGTPQGDSGAWGTWSNTVMGAAKLLGDRTALKALKEGEESGLKTYDDLAQDASLPPDVRGTLATLKTRQQQHIRELDQLMAAA